MGREVESTNRRNTIDLPRLSSGLSAESACRWLARESDITRLMNAGGVADFRAGLSAANLK